MPRPPENTGLQNVPGVLPPMRLRSSRHHGPCLPALLVFLTLAGNAVQAAEDCFNISICPDSAPRDPVLSAVTNDATCCLDLQLGQPPASLALPLAQGAAAGPASARSGNEAIIGACSQTIPTTELQERAAPEIQAVPGIVEGSVATNSAAPATPARTTGNDHLAQMQSLGKSSTEDAYGPRQCLPMQHALLPATARWNESLLDDAVTGAWVSVDDTALAATRGGFDLGGGMSISFGLTRMVTINGELVVNTSIQIPDLSRLNGAQSAILATQLGSVRLVQNGSITTLDDARLPGFPGTTIIQNSLNNQMIKSRTILDVNVGSLGILKGFNNQSTLRDAIVNAVSPH